MHLTFINSLLGGDFSALDISITSIATYLNERTRHTASIIDLTFHRRHWRKALREGIEKNQPDIIAISCNTMYMQYVKTIVAEVKAEYKLPIILGGHHASIYPEETIDIEGCDVLCIGDGEEPLTKYLDSYSEKKNAGGISGIWTKDNGIVTKNQGGWFERNIDDLPIPDWDLWVDLDKYFYHLGMLYMIGSRGCPYRCTYCDAHGISKAVEGKYFRMRDPVKYAQEIAYQWRKYRHRNLRLAQLFDPVFTMKEEWVEAFCDEYRAQGIEEKFRYSVFSRLDHLSENKIKLLAKSGCAILRVGVEAGDPFIRNEIYKKKVSDEKIREMFKLAKSYGICFTAFYILGGPCETPKTLQKTIDLAYELDGERSAFFIYKPFTKEGIKQIMEYGGWVDEEKWAKADNITFDAVVYTKDLTPGQVERYQKKAYFWTFGRRLLRMIVKQKHLYFVRLFIYMFRGLRDGLSFSYLITYYHIYAYDNVDK
jgi:anaerobic magnesium-protoporphyrin IX monomethyl ester cyclase